MIPSGIYPAILISMGNPPPVYIFKKVLIVSPFALMIGIFNPFLYTEIMTRIGDFSLSGGWIFFTSIIGRSTLLLHLNGYP